MTLNFNTNKDNHEEWLTPPYIIQALGKFDLDPCAPINRPWPTADNHYTIENDGLKMPWAGRVWCNPPYGRETFKWLKKLADQGNGIGLIFARTETAGFHNEVWNKADAVLFFRNRLNFHRVDGSRADRANAPSCLVAYGKNNIEAIRRSGLEGHLVLLKEGDNHVR